MTTLIDPIPFGHIESGKGAKLTVGAPEMPVTVPADFPVPRPTTGTVDDEDELEDEHEGENEAREHESSDDMELPEEFERDSEDRANVDK